MWLSGEIADTVVYKLWAPKLQINEKFREKMSVQVIEKGEHRVSFLCVSPSANSKNVSWLLGRDGEVAVDVIGEVDELTSKFICSGIAEKKTPSPQNNAK